MLIHLLPPTYYKCKSSNISLDSHVPTWIVCFLAYIYFVWCVFQLPTRRVWAWLFFAKWCGRTPKSLTVWITTNCGKFLKRWEYQTTWPASWEICMQIKKQQLELDMEQQTGSKLWKEYVKAVYCHPAYLTYMQSTSWETLGWKKHKLESRLPGEISIT